MYRNLTLCLTAFLLILAGCSSSRPTADTEDATGAAEMEPEPIRVLAISATHGFRHGPAIARSKEVFAGIADSTELRIDTTENVADLNTENLSGYDVLMFNNSTLRLAGGGDGSAEDDGAWRIYDLTLDYGQGTMDATVTLNGEPGDLSGTIDFDGARIGDVRGG